jgi:hypothetical protein
VKPLIDDVPSFCDHESRKLVNECGKRDMAGLIHISEAFYQRIMI